MCLWCSDKSKVFHSVKATQQHMLDKGHCMLLHEGDAVYEYADFYNYTYVYCSIVLSQTMTMYSMHSAIRYVMLQIEPARGFQIF